MHKLYELQYNLNAAQTKITQLEGEAGQKALVERTLLNRILQLEAENFWYKTKISEVSPATQPSVPETSS